MNRKNRYLFKSIFRKQHFVSRLAVDGLPARFGVKQKYTMHWHRSRPQRLFMVWWPACYAKQNVLRSTCSENVSSIEEIKLFRDFLEYFFTEILLTPKVKKSFEAEKNMLRE